uniref:Puroindoline n=1 Tax=Triticum aestivum TaxID=4565 RepID=Q5NJM3_WHEAT|nr:puroindoline [Triticum aestivum]
MKTLFLLALLALVASTTFAQYSEVGGWYNEVGGGGGSQQCPQGAAEAKLLQGLRDGAMFHNEGFSSHLTHKMVEGRL